ncbi:MAG: D-alanyl-D-alanine dipeptidase [Rhodoferax sp.]
MGAVTAVVEEGVVAIEQISPASHGVVLDLRYASTHNIVGRPLYARPVCLLHRDAAAALLRASHAAQRQGWRLKIFDAFRPQEAQQLLWEHASDKAFVADPRLGSNHTRGVAVDLTLVDAASTQELDMGTGFDDMTPQSHHFRGDVPLPAQQHREALRCLMEDAGFEHLAHEWWHYALPAAHSYPLIVSRRLGQLNPMLAHHAHAHGFT